VKEKGSCRFGLGSSAADGCLGEAALLRPQRPTECGLWCNHEVIIARALEYRRHYRFLSRLGQIWSASVPEAMLHSGQFVNAAGG
jgi:hypothetical protein